MLKALESFLPSSRFLLVASGYSSSASPAVASRQWDTHTSGQRGLMLWQHPEAPAEREMLYPASDLPPAELMEQKSVPPSPTGLHPSSIQEKGRRGRIGGST